MVNYVLSEQNQVDWIFKSTYLNVSYAENDVQQQPKYKLDLLPNVQNYIEEVKPYTTKIREFRGIKNLKLETATAHTTDFDNPPYRDTDGQFGDVNDVVPLLTNTSLTYDLVLQTGVYKDYLDEHTNTNLLRSSTISIVFDRVGDNGVFAMSNAKTYQKNIEAWASDSRTTHYTIALTEGARLRAAILDLYGRVHIGDFTFGNATDRSVHRIVKYTTDLSQDLTQLATMTLAVTNEMKDHQVIITNEYHTLDTITYDQLIGADNHYTVTKGYFEDLNLTLVTAIQRYDYDINSVLRTGSNVAPGVPSEAQLQINAFILEYYNIQQRLIANYMNHVYAPVDEFGNVNHYSIDDANLFSLTPFQEDTPTPKEWGWDSNAWDHSVIEDSEEQQVILWDDGGKNEIVFVEFPNYSSETTFSNDRMGWHVYNSGNKSGVERVHYSSNYIYVVASSIPDHATDWYDPSWKYIQEDNPNVISHQNKTWSIPLDVVVPTTPAETPGSNPIAILRNGIPLFNVKEQTSYWDEEVWHYNVGFQREAFVFGPDTIDEFYWQYRDNADGAVDYIGQYHYYTNPVAIYNDAPYEHSPLLGYAFDGVPIYGPRSYSNTDGTGEIRRLRSSYRLKTGARVAIGTELNVPTDNYDGTIIYDGSFIEDYEYVASLGDLDKHNGRFAITPEYPEGIYAYYVTVDDLNVPVYPYVIGPTYYGTPERSNYDITAPQVVEQSFLINDENEHGIPNLSIDRKERDAGTLVSLPTATDAEELIPVGSKEGLQITVQTNDHTDLASVTASVSFRIYYDADGETKYYALPDANKTTITSVVSRIDTEINVADVTVLPEPMKSSYDSGHSVPGVVFIGTERIEYFDIDVTNNKLLYCRRGTGTTSAEEHGISVSVFSGAVNNILTYEPEAAWHHDSYIHDNYVDADYVAAGSGLLNSETVQATFFNNLPGQALHS